MTTKEKPKLGVSIEKIIFNVPRNISSLECFSIPVVEGAIKMLAELNSRYEVVLFSSLKKEKREKIEACLAYYQIYEQIGLLPENVYLLDKVKQTKARICKKEGISFFLDGSFSDLKTLVRRVPCLYVFRPDPKIILANNAILEKIGRIYDWADLRVALY